MDAWVVWLLVAFGFAIGEMVSGGAFYLAPFAIAAAIASGADALTDDAVSVVVFLVASVSILLLLRPIVTSRLLGGPTHRTNASALIGKQAVVLAPISGSSSDGRVKIDGEVWSAKPFYTGTEIAAGVEVQVVKIEGATALVIE